jgi:hypothetical protein
VRRKISSPNSSEKVLKIVSQLSKLSTTLGLMRSHTSEIYTTRHPLHLPLLLFLLWSMLMAPRGEPMVILSVPSTSTNDSVMSGNKKSSSPLPAAPPQTKTRRKGKRTIQETEATSSPLLESIVEETASDVAEILPPARKITRRQSAMEIATTIDNSKPSTRPRRAASRK